MGIKNTTVPLLKQGLIRKCLRTLLIKTAQIKDKNCSLVYMSLTKRLNCIRNYIVVPFRLHLYPGSAIQLFHTLISLVLVTVPWEMVNLISSFSTHWQILTLRFLYRKPLDEEHASIFCKLCHFLGHW